MLSPVAELWNIGGLVILKVVLQDLSRRACPCFAKLVACSINRDVEKPALVVSLELPHSQLRVTSVAPNDRVLICAS